MSFPGNQADQDRLIAAEELTQALQAELRAAARGAPLDIDVHFRRVRDLRRQLIQTLGELYGNEDTEPR